MGGMFGLLDRLDVTEIKPVIVLCIEQSTYEWLGLNRGQLHKGTDNLGNLQSPQYAQEGYAEYKNQLNPVPGLGVPDFFVSGTYYNSIQMTVNANQYSIKTYSNDSEVAPKIEAKWNRNYGLNPENIAYFGNEIVLPKIVKELKSNLGL